MSKVLSATVSTSTLRGRRDEIVELLDFLPVLYPGGDRWLERRLDEVQRGDGWCALLDQDGEITGVAIGVVKPGDRFKICTLFVRPESRRTGGGVALLRVMMGVARARRARTVYVTVAHTLSDELWSILEPAGFKPIVTQLNRYGDDRHETVFSADLDAD